jgi:hypothetical protein
MTPATHSVVKLGLTMVRQQLHERGSRGLYDTIANLVLEGDLERATILVLAVTMKVRKERKSAALVVALGVLLFALVRYDNDDM